MQWEIVGVYNAQADTWRILLRVQKNGMSLVPAMAFELPPFTAEEFFKTIPANDSSYQANVSATTLPETVVRILNRFSNLRELQHVIERAVLLGDSLTIDVQEVHEALGTLPETVVRILNRFSNS